MFHYLWNLVPESTKILLRGDYNYCSARFIDRPRDWLALQTQRLLGKNFLNWYARRLDQAANQVSTGEGGKHLKAHEMMKTGREDLEVAKRFGLKPEHSLFEFGTGFGRSAQHFISYLKKKQYCGNDISKGRVRQMTEYFELIGLSNKEPEILVTADNTFDWLNGRKFDYVWTMAVLSHMPDEDVVAFFKNARKIMHENSTLLALDTHIEGYNDVFRYNAKDWFRPPEWYCDAIESVGLVAQNATDKMVAGAGSQNVGHPIGSKGMKFSSHLVAATLK
ncbi:MAG: hypothetical protein CMM76_14005 [Rhodospirillaceae bacterium]|nr:hypothetical protein [Rhodospirillaceae bacterium]